MKKYLFVLIVIALGISDGQLQAQGKIGYINPQEVLAQLPESQAIERRLTEMVQQKRAEFSVREEAFLAQVRDLQERVQAQSISEAEIGRQRQALEVQQEELYELLDSHELEVRRRQQELLRPLLSAIDTAISDVARELGLDYVLNELTTEGEMILLFVSQDGENRYNITNRVVQKLK
jgi:outer membrane protein